MQEPVTTSLATGAVTSPLWLPYLTELSEISATLLALTGAAWFITQMWAKKREDNRQQKEFEQRYHDNKKSD